ncbi:MAG: hypothetical protein JXR94_23480 [Candidatus Hydrogenedentes bacterium]|nr:hypothetical protein [Candidatus Hydrogenedentota bacterium]
MSLLGLDVGTTGCKASAFSEDGRVLATAYEEYDNQRPQPGWAELDSVDVWNKVKATIARAASETHRDPVQAIAVSSLGEAMVPVSADRRILAPSILNFDVRGEEYLERLASVFDDESLYAINGNTLGNHYALTKLLWLKHHAPELFEQAHKFLLWGSFVSFMLGGDCVADYSLANRTLLFDLERKAWSDDLLGRAGLDADKFPDTAPSGTVVGTVNPAIAGELGLPAGVAIVTGAHDQCANALGCGVIDDGQAMFGMGTYICIAPVFAEKRDPNAMIQRGLNTEHHSVPGKYVCFIYNHGGSLLKWFRDTFAAAEHRAAQDAGADVYPALIAEIPDGPSTVKVLPHFSITGPPEFISDSTGVITGLRLETTRGDICKAILEGAVFYLRECVESLPPTGIAITDFRAVGGGSKSDAWLQICADILDRPFTRPRITEAGALGAAILAGAATGVFASHQDGVNTMVHPERTFEPDSAMHARYAPHYDAYRRLWPTIRPWITQPPQ